MPKHDEHGHDHDHAHELGHSHHHNVNAKNQTRMALAAILTGLFMVAEVIGGIVSGSLALIADAGHMMTDCAALTLAWFGFKLGQRPANARYTFGYDRFAILAAFVNGLSLFAVAIWIILEAIKRFNEPVEVMGLPMLIVAGLGLVVNIIVFIILMGADKENLNIRSAVLHVLGDLLGSAAAIGAAIVIILTGWMPADLIMSVLVSLIVLRGAYYVVKHSAHILLEGTPERLNPETIKADLKTKFPHITEIDNIHIWSISQEYTIIMLDIHIANSQISTATIREYLAEKFDIKHITIEIKIL
ncbi:MAG: cation transporter [Robiginitomaculum sp.]|nr:MAG: cation transporter [Robiginitomaculum sp.]